MVNIFKRKKLFDEDADWVPQKGRAFKMKAKPPKEEPKEEPNKEMKHEPKQNEIKTGAEGMDRAYAQGGTYIEDNKMFVADHKKSAMAKRAIRPFRFCRFNEQRTRETNFRNRRLETIRTLPSRS